MTIQQLLDAQLFTTAESGNPKREISSIFCCDLLSIAMSKAPADGIWVTVMGNKNTLAVASLTDVSCIVLAEGIQFAEAELNCAKEEGITVLMTEEPIFDAALKVYKLVNA